MTQLELLDFMHHARVCGRGVGMEQERLDSWNEAMDEAQKRVRMWPVLVQLLGIYGIPMPGDSEVPR